MEQKALGHDPDTNPGKTPRYDWLVNDNHGQWNCATVAEFAQVEPDIYIYRALIPLDDLTPQLVEVENARAVRAGEDPVEDDIKESARDLLERWSQLENYCGDEPFATWRDHIPWSWGEPYEEDDVTTLAREMQAQMSERSIEQNGWRDMSHNFQKGFPPIVVSRNKEGELSILEGNHRVHFWQAAEYEYAPAWVNDGMLRELEITPEFEGQSVDIE